MSTMSGGSATPQTRQRVTLPLGDAALWTAGVVGALYAWGALLKATELHGASVVVKDALPLVPVHQLLVRGLGEALSLGTAAMAAIVLALVWFEWRLGAPPPGGRRGTKKQFHLNKYALWAIAGGSLVVGVVLLPVPFGTWFVVVFVLDRLEDAGRMRPVRKVAIIGLSWIIWNAAFSYFEPAPLPRIEITTAQGSVISGQLLAHGDSTWYVSDGRRRMRGVVDREVRVACIEFPVRAPSREVYRLVLGLPPRDVTESMDAPARCGGASATRPRR